MEKIKRNKNRVDIAKLTTTDNSGADLTGGYIIKIDKTTGGGGEGWNSNYYNVANKTYYQYDYPKAKEITSAQKSYIQTWVRNMESALYQEKYTGTGSYHEYLNDASFIDFMIINEFAKNVDGYRLSSFLYKGKNDKMNCGPIWDFNLTYGNADYYNGWTATGFQYQANLTQWNGQPDYWQNPFWWNKLLRDPDYVNKLKKRWATLRKKELSGQRITFVIDSLTSLIAEAKDRNYQRWPIIGVRVWPNYYIGNSYLAEVNWMKSWITNRLAFLDQQWPYNFTGNENQLAAHQFSTFPNPFNEHLNIKLSPGIADGEAYVEFIGMDGKLIRKSKIEIQDHQIQLTFSGQGALHPGLYLLRITRNNGILLTEKILKTF
jgi:hypothetical protein